MLYSDKKNARALNLLKSWLGALQIAYRPGTETGVDLVVEGRQGPVSVQVAASDSPAAPEGTLVVASGDLTGRDIRNALSVFSDLVATLGCEYREPVSRGAIPTQKLDYHDNFEEVLLRHTELRRCPNPAPGELERYDTVIQKATALFLHAHHIFCGVNTLAHEDLYSCAQMWTIIFLGYYKNDEGQGNNEGKLMTFLKQRFMELKAIYKKKTRNVFVSPLSSSCMHTMSSYSLSLIGETNEEEIDQEYLRRHNELDLRSPDKRRASAALMLTRKLRELPHDKMLLLLSETSANEMLHPDARSEAVRQLRYHHQTCSICASNPLLQDDLIGIHEDEDFARIDEGSIQE